METAKQYEMCIRDRFTVMTVDSDNPILITSMVEDVKNRGGSGYVVNHTKQLLDNYLK